MLLHFMKRPSETFEGEQKGEQIRFTIVYSTVKPLDMTGFPARENRNIPFCDIIFCNEVTYEL